MTNINDLYPSKYLKASDLQGREFHLVINNIQVETLGTGDRAQQKPVIYFQGAQKGMALNRSNADEIANVYGLDTDAWIGKRITLYPSTTRFANQVVPCIKVRPHFQGNGGRPAVAQNPLPPNPTFVPNAAQRLPQGNDPVTGRPLDDDPNDPVPF